MKRSRVNVAGCSCSKFVEVGKEVVESIFSALDSPFS